MSTPPLPKTIGKYEVLSLLGRGGMGVVYRALDPVIDRIVAIKTISTTEAVQEGEEYLVARLKMEARSAGRLHHPNIVTVFDFGEQDDVAFIVMEYVEGVNLARIIAQKRPLSLAKKIDILIQIAQGLAYAHEFDVVHRDMKPANVCVTSKDVAKILDFGLARFDTTRLTKTGFLSGTVAYMSPERLRGQSGPSDDIFALGVIAYELLTYQPAFTGTTPPEVMYSLMSTTPQAPSAIADLPEEIDPILMKAIEKNPANRYASAAEFATALQNFRNEPAFKYFISDKRRTQELENSAKNFVDVDRPGIHPYSAAAMTPAQPKADPELKMPTELLPAARFEATEVQPQPTEREFAMAGPSTDEDLDFSTRAVSAPTVVTRQPRAHAPRWVYAAAGVAALAILAIVLAVRSPAPVTPDKPQQVSASPVPRAAAPAQTVSAPVPAPAAAVPSDNAAKRVAAAQAEWSELNRRVAEKLFAASRDGLVLSGTQKSRLEKRLEALRSEVERGRDDLVRAEAKEILRAYDRALHAPAPAAPPPAAKPVQVAEEPKTPPVEPAPAAVAVPPPAPAPKPAEDPRREIASFIRRMASAYQSRDAGFFRENYIRYSEQLGKAIQGSPSVRVDIEIVSIEMRDASTALVTATRTDTFANSGAPPAVQRLVYELTRTADGWKLAAFRRA